jgi:hypothetical protein
MALALLVGKKNKQYMTKKIQKKEKGEKTRRKEENTGVKYTVIIGLNGEEKSHAAKSVAEVFKKYGDARVKTKVSVSIKSGKRTISSMLPSFVARRAFVNEKVADMLGARMEKQFNER